MAKTPTKTDQYEEITNQIIAAMEKGPGAWSKPWNCMGINGAPKNGSSNRKYSGVNVWLLAMAGFSDARWFTYKQASELGAQVKAGSKGTKIVFWKFLKKDEKQADGSTKEKKVPMMRTFTLFNAEQIDGLPGVEAPPVVDPATKYADAAAFIESLNVRIEHGGDRACYSMTEDMIRLPQPGQFKSIEDYFATSFHEHAHSTAHKDRLNRGLFSRFGSEAYAMEELVAELSSAFLCANMQIEGTLQHPQYLANWIQVLKGDKYAIFSAAREAQRATEYLLEKGGRNVKVEAPTEQDEDGTESVSESEIIAA